MTAQIAEALKFVAENTSDIKVLTAIDYLVDNL